MTAFQFMASAFYVPVGVMCLSFAALFITGAVIAIRRAAKKEKTKDEQTR